MSNDVAAKKEGHEEHEGISHEGTKFLIKENQSHSVFFVPSWLTSSCLRAFVANVFASSRLRVLRG